MKTLPELTRAQTTRLWREAKKEYPGDEMMQEIHFARRKLQLQVKGLPAKERIKFYNDAVGELDDSRKRKTG